MGAGGATRIETCALAAAGIIDTVKVSANNTANAIFFTTIRFLLGFNSGLQNRLPCRPVFLFNLAPAKKLCSKDYIPPDNRFKGRMAKNKLNYPGTID
jgi:hypothetical protein